MMVLKASNKYFITENFFLIFLFFLTMLFSGYDNNKMICIGAISSFVILFFVLVWKMIEMKTTKWIITQEQIVYERGVLYRKKDYIELYRIIDFQEEQSLIERVFKIKKIIIASGDKSHPRLIVYGLRRDDEIINFLREGVEANKKLKRVYEISNS